MDISNDFPGQARARFWFVFALFIFLMALAHGGAELKGWLDAHATAGTEVHTVLYYRVVFSIWATIFLLTPALCFHVFSVADRILVLRHGTVAGVRHKNQTAPDEIVKLIVGASSL